MSGKLKIGVFGGYRGMTMITVLMGHPDAELVAVCDKVQWILDNVKNEAEKHGQTVACYNNFEDFFKHDMDAVVLANYANEHAPYAIRLLRSGRHVLSEVLPCETMAQAVELIEAVEESGCVYAYAENYCYMAHTFEMWRRYQNGDIGEVMYAEGEYVHDCSSIWPGITYGERNHWRNRMHPAFYCTHSIGPMLTITGRRPVQVVGFETMPHPDMIALGGIGGMAGGCMIAVTLDNGAICKSIHGGLKREPGSINYEVYGMKGMMESDRFDGGRLNVYREGEKLCIGDWEKYETKPFIAPELLEKIGVYGHCLLYTSCGSVPVRHPIQTSCWTGPGNATGRTRIALVYSNGKGLPSRAVQYPPDRPLAGTYAGGTPGPATRHSSPARMARETPSARPELRCFTDTGRVWPTSSGRGSRSAGRRGQSLRPGPRR